MSWDISRVFIRKFQHGPFEDVFFLLNMGIFQWYVCKGMFLLDSLLKFSKSVFEKMYVSHTDYHPFLSQQMDLQGSWYSPKKRNNHALVWQVDNNMLHVLYDQGSLYITNLNNALIFPENLWKNDHRFLLLDSLPTTKPKFRRCEPWLMLPPPPSSWRSFIGWGIWYDP